MAIGGVRRETGSGWRWRLSGWLGLVAIALLAWSFSPLPSAAATGGELQPLTAELLAERLATPQTVSGAPTLDFSDLRLDLSNEAGELRDRFYTDLRAALEGSSQLLTLDLSHSTIQGTLDLTRLAQRVPLLDGALNAVLTPGERDRLPENLDDLKPPAAAADGVSDVRLLRCAVQLKETRLLAGLAASDLVVLQPVRAAQAIARGPVTWERSYFARALQWQEAKFSQAASFRGSYFAAAVQFTDSEFQALADWRETQFAQGGDFSGDRFEALGDWQRSQWQAVANFARTHWFDRALFSRSRFVAPLDLMQATFEKAAALRAVRFNAPVKLTEASLLNQIDFSEAVFVAGAEIAADGLAFDSDRARVLGDKGKIGNVIALSGFEGNENVLRNLIRNFRRLEQIPDANHLEYKLQQLRLQQLSTLIGGTRLDWHFLWRRGPTLLVWAGLSVVLLLSHYGTNVYLVLSSGGFAVACFSLLVWYLDRWRRPPSQIRPQWGEIAWMLGSASVLILLSGLAIAQCSTQPWIGLLCLNLLVLPIPLAIVLNFYRRGGDRDQRDEPYLLENIAERQLGIAIVRLPVLPRYAFFRDRYAPIPWGRRWNWLNYYGFCLNTFLKISFNDLRLRDARLPGSVSAIAWYQWSLGILYIALLLWTLSRTIPGLNLLIYLS